MFFSANGGANAYGLWMTDGTTAGTQLVKNIDIFLYSGDYPRGFLEYDSNLYFNADDGTNGFELWASNGTTSGTKMLKDINPTGSSYPTEFIEFNGQFIFSANDGTNGFEVWVSDGSDIGTKILKDINPIGSAYPYFFTEYNGELFFTSYNATNGFELWVSDGTTLGTNMLKDINPNGTGGPNQFIKYSNHLYFKANDEIYGDQLWRTDGTTAGTKMFMPEIAPFSNSLDTTEMCVFGGSLYYLAHYTNVGTELYKFTDKAVGIEEYSLKKIKIFPNPTDEYVNVHGLEQAEDFSLYNIIGDEVMKFRLSKENNSFSIKDFPAGFYFLKSSRSISRTVIIKR